MELFESLRYSNMLHSPFRLLVTAIITALILIAVVGSFKVLAQYAERRDLVGFGGTACDASGRSIKSRRVRAIHSENADLPGGTAYLIRKDPFLAYQLGRDLNFREFRLRDGVFSALIANLSGVNPDGTSTKITANNHTSCLGCHSIPSGNPGGGPNFSKDSGRGRKTPHYFGAGIMEMLALQIRAQMMSRLDQNRNGWIEIAEAAASQGHVQVAPAPGAPAIDYGDPRLSRSTTGTPGLNNIFKVWYVDKNGIVVDGATEVDGKKTFGYGFAMMVWGWGQGPKRSGMNPTNRTFLWDPFETHGGLQAYDPSTTNDPDGNGASKPTLPGAVQFPALRRPPDVGARVDERGFSKDDPDGDGYLNEISEGDLDLGEWFMLNVPRPAFAGTPAEFAGGVALMNRWGCNQCHVNEWQILPKDQIVDGDRRIFDFDVRWNQATSRLEGRLVRLYSKREGQYAPNRRGFFVRGLFSDLRHHDLGPDLAEMDFGGTINQIWRTAPLWGVGSSFPWDHDGSSLTIEDSIRRHGGEAASARANFLSAPASQRQTLLRMLDKLVLYDIESLPADIDGNGIIDQHFMAAGKDTGTERFNAEWLFRTPLQIQGLVKNMDGVSILSFAGLNIPEAYGENLDLLRDTDGDGWPDFWDRAPLTIGYKDGVD
jgi:Di-haem oxidoreductase, putative peroxidase